MVITLAISDYSERKARAHRQTLNSRIKKAQPPPLFAFSVRKFSAGAAWKLASRKMPVAD
jgi:hypothetical protein